MLNVPGRGEEAGARPDLALVSGLRRTLLSSIGTAIDGAPRAALLDRPDYPNVGDSAIWEGQKRALAELGVILAYQAGIGSYSAAECRAALDDDGIVLLSGGGNLGDLWPEHQLFRERVLKDFSERRVVVLPQSVHFTSAASLRAARDAMNRHPHLTVLAREEQSRSVLAHDLEIDAPLVPDAALALGGLERGAPDRDIVWIVRRDVESLHRWPRRTGGWDRSASSRAAPPPERVRRGCERLGRARVVITDRLHGHILCLLMGIPHVVLDNSYGKISAFIASWTQDSSLTTFAHDPADAEAKARRLLRETV